MYNDQSIDFGKGFEIWSERLAIAECLVTIGLPKMASNALNPSTSQEIIDNYINIIKNEAKASRRHDVLKKLCFAGLMNG